MNANALVAITTCGLGTALINPTIEIIAPERINGRNMMDRLHAEQMS